MKLLEKINNIFKNIINKINAFQKKILNGRRIKKTVVIITLINSLFTLFFAIYICKLNLLSIKYTILIIFIFIIMNMGILLLISRKKSGMKYIGYGLTAILLLMSSIGIYYISKTNDFLNKSFNNATNTYTNTYYIMTLNQDKYKELTDVKILGYHENIPNIKEALSVLKKTVSTNNIEYEDFDHTFDALKNEEIDSVIMEKTLYNFIVEYDSNFKKDNYKIIYSFDVTLEEENDEVSHEGDTFNIYIGGTDFTELYTDFNMIVTINKKTHKILLTSTPRDYYVELYGKGGSKDLLGYAGVWGTNTSKKTLENLYGIKIDYYVKINTKSLVGLVDTLGGVEFCSDISYTTTHAMVMGTYDDTIGKKLYVNKGCKNYNGIQILTIARERKAYPDGDRQRQKNCQQIMINIFNKMTRAENIVNYTSILNAVGNLYTTNIPKDLVTELARNTVNHMGGWKFETQSVTGRDSRGYVHLSNIMDYVMVPDKESVNKASQKIKAIQAGK